MVAVYKKHILNIKEFNLISFTLINYFSIFADKDFALTNH